MPTSITPRRSDASTFVLDIQGDITSASEGALMNAYTTATDQGARTLVLNFAGLEYMNSGGIGLLVTLLIRANRAKQKLRVCGLSEHYNEIFQLTRLDDAIGIFPTEAAAVGAIQ